MNDELVARLRQLAKNTGKMTWVNDLPMPATAVLHNSADEIERLTAQLAEARESERAAMTEGAGEVARLLSEVDEETAYAFPWSHEQACRQAAATIVALKAEIERLTEREAQAKLDGVRAGIEASAAWLSEHRGDCEGNELMERPSYYRCTASKTPIFTVGTVYEVVKYDDTGRAILITDKNTQSAIMGEVAAQFAPYDPWAATRAAALSDLIAGDADLIAPEGGE